MKVDLKRGDRRIGEGIEAKNINNFGTKVKKERCEQLFFWGVLEKFEVCNEESKCHRL